MKLLSLQLDNFKGLKHEKFKFDGKSCSILGDNGTGKTTLYDAFLWLLFDKDSQNRKDFEIKTLDQQGHPVHGLEHSVEAVLDVNDRQVSLRKVFSEKWTKKRGSAKAEFTGHTTDYFVDGVPVKKAEYEATITSFCDENAFKLLTSPLYFNTQLHWQKRREILLQVCGDISDADVIASDASLAQLPDILQNRKLEDHRKVIAARRSEINKELEKIPVRISEVQNSLSVVSDLALGARNLPELRAIRQKKQTELVTLEAGGAIAEKKKQVQEVEEKILISQNKHRMRIQGEIVALRKEMSKINETLFSLQYKIENAKKMLAKDKNELFSLETRLEMLRSEWQQVNNQQFVYEQASVCPTCGQPLPEEKLTEAREKALVEFNLRKAETLENIIIQGKMANEEMNRIEVEIEAYIKQAEEAKEEIEKKQTEATYLQAKIENLETEPENDEIKFHRQTIFSLEKEIESLRIGNTTEIEALRAEIAKIDQAIMDIEKEQAKQEQNQRGLARIEELKTQERKLAAEYEKLESEIYLTEQFIRTKVALLEEKINSRFKLAKFKLFNILVNGAVEECCEATVNGVPYSSVNNGARIQAGLDIINTLCEYYDFYPPIWIDNKESVSWLPETKNQLINLYVSAEDNYLRMETIKNQNIIKEAI